MLQMNVMITVTPRGAPTRRSSCIPAPPCTVHERTTPLNRLYYQTTKQAAEQWIVQLP
jgi:hypothetical protein